jgi:hypothetical protein
MKTKTLKKLLITFSISLAAGFGIVWACAGGDESWYGFSDFTPENFTEPSYKPLLYAPYVMFYDINYDESNNTRFSSEIVKDWSEFLNGKMKESDVRYFLLSDSSKADVESLMKNPPIQNNRAQKINVKDSDIKEFIEFLYYAKQIEQSSEFAFDYWDYENAKKPPKMSADLISQVEKKYQTEKTTFIKNRYWFQTLKAYFYSDSPAVTSAFFEKTKNDVPKNTLYYRALSYIAGIEYKAKNYARSNYLNSIVFDKCPTLRVPAVYGFHPQNETDWNESLKLAQTNDEKVALWAMLGYYTDEARAIDEIFKLNPKSPHLDYLLTRLINKQELALNEIKIESGVKYKNDIKEKLDKNSLNTVNIIALSEKTAKPYFWNLAAGYLQTMNGNYAQARTFFDKSEKEIPADQNIKDQLRLLRFINTLSEITVMDKTSENKILADLKWVLLDLKSDSFRSEKAFNWSKLYISALYSAQNNVVFSELFNPNPEFYHNSDKLEAMKTFLAKTEKTDFEQLSEKIYPDNLSDIYSYQAVMNTFQNKIDDALACMAKADKIKDENLLGNPFNGNIQDCHDCDHAAFQKTKYSKYRLIEIIQIMENKVKNGEDLYNNYLLLGNAFYNITYFGNARCFYEGKIIGESMSTPWMIDKYYQKTLLDMTVAKSYYQKAYDTAATKEQKAQCAYMLAKCERNEYYNQAAFISSDWETDLPADFLAWNGFKLLKTQYSDTKYYKDVIRECGYFSKFAGN